MKQAHGNKGLKKTQIFNIFKQVRRGNRRLNRGTSVVNEGVEILHLSPLPPATEKKKQQMIEKKPALAYGLFDRTLYRSPQNNFTL